MTPYGLRTVPLALAVATVLAQIGYPLVHGSARDHLTVVVVLLFAATSVGHAGVTRGWTFALLLLVITAGLGFGASIAATHPYFGSGGYYGPGYYGGYYGGYGYGYRGYYGGRGYVGWLPRYVLPSWPALHASMNTSS